MNNIDLFNALNEQSKLSTNICYSGGASGSDRFFGIWASKNNHELIHYGFKNHSYKGHDEIYNVIVPQELLDNKKIKDALNTANKKLGRKVPNAGYVYNLLARNYYQILNTDRVYCMVNEVNRDTVGGGTGWAVQMYIDKEPNPEIYAYSVGTGLCFEYSAKESKFIEVPNVPKPYGRWTGIGTRKCSIQDLGKFSKHFLKE